MPTLAVSSWHHICRAAAVAQSLMDDVYKQSQALSWLNPAFLLTDCSIISEVTRTWVGAKWEKPVLLEGWTRLLWGSGRENDGCTLLSWTMSSVPSMTKCQCDRVLWFGGSFHWGRSRSASGVRLSALHNNQPHKPLILPVTLSTPVHSVIYLFLWAPEWFLPAHIRKQTWGHASGCTQAIRPHLYHSELLSALFVSFLNIICHLRQSCLCIHKVIHFHNHLSAHWHTNAFNLPFTRPSVPITRRMVHLQTARRASIIHRLRSHLWHRVLVFSLIYSLFLGGKMIYK